MLACAHACNGAKHMRARRSCARAQCALPRVFAPPDLDIADFLAADDPAEGEVGLVSGCLGDADRVLHGALRAAPERCTQRHDGRQEMILCESGREGGGEGGWK